MNNMEILRKLKLLHVTIGWVICGYNEIIGHYTENDIELLTGVIADLKKCRAAMSENLRGGKNAETDH